MKLKRNSMIYSLLPLMLLTFMVSGCLTQTRVLYAGSYRLPPGIKGQMRVAQKTVAVVVVGDEKSAKAKADVAGFTIIHPLDLSQLVLQTKALKILAKDSALKEKIAEILKALQNTADE